MASPTPSSSTDTVTFIYVIDDMDAVKFNSYARYHLLRTFQLMGCKISDAHEITAMLFDWVQAAHSLWKREKRSNQSERRHLTASSPSGSTATATTSIRVGSLQEDNVNMNHNLVNRNAREQGRSNGLRVTAANHRNQERIRNNGSIDNDHSTYINGSDKNAISRSSSSGGSGSAHNHKVDNDDSSDSSDEELIYRLQQFGSSMTAAKAPSATPTMATAKETLSTAQSSRPLMRKKLLQRSSGEFSRDYEGEDELDQSQPGDALESSSDNDSDWEVRKRVDDTTAASHSKEISHPHRMPLPNANNAATATTAAAIGSPVIKPETSKSYTDESIPPCPKTKNRSNSTPCGKSIRASQELLIKRPTTFTQESAHDMAVINEEFRNIRTKRRPNKISVLQLGFGLHADGIRKCRNKSQDVHLTMTQEIAKFLHQNQSLFEECGSRMGSHGANLLTQQTINSGGSDVVWFTRQQFLEINKVALAAYEYCKPTRIEDFDIASQILDRKKPLVILFGGTSGCGKSTLASLMASRLGITKVLSTDSIRHMLRGFTSEKDNPALFASTYHAGERLNPVKYGHLSAKERVIEGYRQQCRPVIDQLSKIITNCEMQNEPLLVEGVHLLTDYMVELMAKHTSVIPFVIHIGNKQKHKERFAIRAKYMTLNPRDNKYIKYFESITSISELLCERADAFSIPKVDNSNMDRSLAAIHFSIFKCLRRMNRGEPLFDAERNVVTMPALPVLWSSKRMLGVIRKKRASPVKSDALRLKETTFVTSRCNSNEEGDNSEDELVSLVPTRTEKNARSPRRYRPVATASKHSRDATREKSEKNSASEDREIELVKSSTTTERANHAKTGAVDNTISRSTDNIIHDGNLSTEPKIRSPLLNQDLRNNMSSDSNKDDDDDGKTVHDGGYDAPTSSSPVMDRRKSERFTGMRRFRLTHTSMDSQGGFASLSDTTTDNETDRDIVS